MYRSDERYHSDLNKIMSKSWNGRQVRLLLHLFWLYRGRCCSAPKHLAASRQEVKTFLGTKRLTFPELETCWTHLFREMRCSFQLWPCWRRFWHSSDSQQCLSEISRRVHCLPSSLFESVRTGSQYGKFSVFAVSNYRNANIVWERILSPERKINIFYFSVIPRPPSQLHMTACEGGRVV